MRGFESRTRACARTYYFQADVISCHIITVTNDTLNNVSLLGKDLTEFFLETVRMFYNDARQAGYML